MKNLVIIGTGGFAREVYWHAHDSEGFQKEWKIKGFLDGDVKLSVEEYSLLPENVPVLGDINNYEICPDDVFTCAIGTPKVRRKLVEKFLERGAKFINMISKTSYIAPTAKIGQGVILSHIVTVSDHAEVGDFAVINFWSGMGHDAKIGKFTCVMSYVNISGGAKIGDEVFVAGNVVISPKAIVDDRAFVGLGSVVLKRVRAGTKVFGNPAMEI